MEEVEVVVAHSERATLRVGDVFLKVDADQARLDTEIEAMAVTPVPTPQVLWHKPPVLALAAVPGTPLGRLGGPATGSPAAWAAAGAAIRTLHDAPLPPRTGQAGRSTDTLTVELDNECELLVTHGVSTPSSRAARSTSSDPACDAVRSVLCGCRSAVSATGACSSDSGERRREVLKQGHRQPFVSVPTESAPISADAWATGTGPLAMRWPAHARSPRR